MNSVELFLQQNILETKFQPGHVWLAGAGPGDPRYLTVEVLCALVQADALVYDALVDAKVLALSENSRKYFAGKRGGKPSTSQEDITALLISLAQSGKKVLRLKGGDPFIFGRAGEEIQELVKAHIPVRVLSGITSAFAALTRAHIPMTMRGVNKAIILATGHSADESSPELDWKALAKTGQPLVIYMGLKNIEFIAKNLIDGGLKTETPVAIISAAATAKECLNISSLGRVVEDVQRHHITAPALFAVGDIVALRDVLTGTFSQEEIS